MSVEMTRAVPLGAIDNAMRLLHLDLLYPRAEPVDSETLREWKGAMDWFPHLKYEKAITDLALHLPERWLEGQVCDPQILLHFPHDPRHPVPEVTYHTDQEPPWANGRKYVRIVGVALSAWTHHNGSLIIPSYSRVGLSLQPGDAVMMTADVEHSPGINLSGEVRYGVYFRWLEP